MIFLAGGSNADWRERAAAIRERSAQPMFVPFVGIGQEEFPFLRELVGLPGRPIDLAGFRPVNDLDTIEDLELYDRLLNEFPKWLEAARARLWA